MDYKFTNDEIFNLFEDTELTFNGYYDYRFHFDGYEHNYHIYAVIGDGTIETMKYISINSPMYIENFEEQFDGMMITREDENGCILETVFEYYGEL